MNLDLNTEISPTPSPQSKIPLIIGVVMLVGVLCVALVLGWGYIKQNIPHENLPEPTLTPEQVLQKQIDEVLAQANPETHEQLKTEIEKAIDQHRSRATSEFVYDLVPNALEAISLPPPPESKEADKSAYEETKSAVDPVLAGEGQSDTVGNLPFGGVSWGEYLDSLESNLDIYQIYFELEHLTYYFNELYKRDQLKDRIEGVELMADFDPDASDLKLTYPSLRAVEGYATAEIMARLEPISAADYRKTADAFVARGMTYGLYGKSDIDVSRSLVEQYFKLLDTNNMFPPLLLPTI